MSPQPRRGRAAPAGHRKSTSRAVPLARKPAAAIEPVEAEETVDNDELDETTEATPARRQARPLRRQRGLARVRRSSAAHYTYDAVKAYIPLLIAFVILFGGVWAWISFGPHAPTPKENWTSIENAWLQKRENDRQAVTDAIDNFQTQLTAYKAFRDDTRGWMNALAAIPNWDDPQASADVNATTNSDVQTFIQAGNDEATLLDQVVAAKSPNDVLALGSQIIAAEQTFATDYELARTDIFGVAPASPEPTLALPSGSLPPSASPGASGSPGASAGPTGSPAASASAVPSGSPGPSGSPPSGSPAPSASPPAGASPKPS
ncbi:MAG: hypothetical protein ACHQ01_05490 [Candidatus Limnocylindrales bacterium]